LLFSVHLLTRSFLADVGYVLLSIILAHVHRHAGKLRDLEKRINLMEKADAEMYKEDK
jgi:hypothetical protein